MLREKEKGTRGLNSSFEILADPQLTVLKGGTNNSLLTRREGGNAE